MVRAEQCGGLFVSFEGPEGSGKTTQIHMLAAHLQAAQRQVVCTREPGGTEIGEKIRVVLHDPVNVTMDPRAEALLYSAARAQHVAERIVPALAEGRIVLTDRFSASTMAYQGYGHGLDLAQIECITAFCTRGLLPDLVIYLDLDVEAGLRRKREDHRQGIGEWNRMDGQAVSFHRRVREGYLRMARQEPERWLVLDALAPREAIHDQILDRVSSML